jgi:predicted Zn-dependent protease
MRHAALVIALVSALVTAAGAARAGEPDPQALPTSRIHVLRARPRFAPGLESAMPRTSIYGRAVALDLEEKFEESGARYREAEAEFNRLPARTPISHETTLAWQRKARWQSTWSQQLALRYGHGLRFNSPYALADLGHVYLLKFLAARAFTGLPPMRLAARGRALLEDALRREPDNLLARLSLATLLREIGEPLAGERELARVNLALARDDATGALRLASYYAAANDRARALEALERFFRRSPQARWGAPDVLRWSNEFDRLRDEPRFRRLLETAYQPRWIH